MPLRYQPLLAISSPCGTWPWILSISPRETQPCLGPPCEIFLRGAIAAYSRKNSSIVFKKHWLIVGTASILCRHKRLAMPLSAEQQFRARARKALAAGEPFEARGEVNKRLLEEVRAEVEQGKASVRDQTSKGVKRIRQVSAEEEARLKDQLKAEGAAQQRLLEEKAASLAACPPGVLRASAAERGGRLGRRRQQRWSRAGSRARRASRNNG